MLQVAQTLVCDLAHEDHRLKSVPPGRDHQDSDEKVTKEANAGLEDGARTKKQPADQPLRSITPA